MHLPVLEASSFFRPISVKIYRTGPATKIIKKLERERLANTLKKDCHITSVRHNADTSCYHENRGLGQISVMGLKSENRLAFLYWFNFIPIFNTVEESFRSLDNDDNRFQY